MPVDQDIRTAEHDDRITADEPADTSSGDVGQLYEEEEDRPRRRPRQRLLAPVPAALLAVILLACGFIAGVHVQKQQGSSASTGATGGARSFGSAASGPTGGPPGASGRSAGSSGTQGGASGTLAFLSGSTLYVTNSAGNTIRVKTTSGTSVTKTVKATVSAIRPGEDVTVTGSTSTGGAITAGSISVGALTGAGFASAGKSTAAAASGSTLFGAG